MSVESQADLAAFLSIADFGTTATYTRTGYKPRQIAGIFDNDFIEVDTGGGVPFATQQPRFLCRTTDVSSIVEGETLVISGATYKVSVVQPDGTGMTNIMLEKQ